MTWRAARSLLTLHSQLRPLAPGAPASSFGLVGDLSHAAGTSDHNPRDFPGWGSSIVTAADFPLAGRLDPRAVLESIRLSRDPRVKYAISRGQMYSSYSSGGIPPWTWRHYSGSDGHFDHGHLSVVGDARADDTRPWAITGGSFTTTTTGDDMAGEVADYAAGHIPYQGREIGLHVATGLILTDTAATRTALAASAQREQDTIAAIKTLAEALQAGGGNLDTAAAPPTSRGSSARRPRTSPCCRPNWPGSAPRPRSSCRRPRRLRSTSRPPNRISPVQPPDPRVAAHVRSRP
jgi:hypothetical protein